VQVREEGVVEEEEVQLLRAALMELL